MSKSITEESEFKWMRIANILSKGFLAVHHGKKLPIDVIEEIQKVYLEDIEQSIQKSIKERDEEIEEKIGDLLNKSESRASELECSQEGYEYGLEDILSDLSQK